MSDSNPVELRASCHLVNATAGAIANGVPVEALLLRALGGPDKVAGGEEIVYKDWNPDPLNINGTNGALLGTLLNFNLAFYRVKDAQGNRVCFETFIHQMNPAGWTNQTDQYRLHVFSRDGGLLDVWDLGAVPILCGAPAGTYSSYRKNFSPDYFDLLGRVQLTFTGGKYFRC